jgi:hypothetical protein
MQDAFSDAMFDFKQEPKETDLFRCFRGILASKYVLGGRVSVAIP